MYGNDVIDLTSAGLRSTAQPKRIDAIKSDLKERPPNWLEVASDAAVAKVKDDYKSWRKSYNAK